MCFDFGNELFEQPRVLFPVHDHAGLDDVLHLPCSQVSLARHAHVVKFAD